jgi:excisionase family DNA binding protein
MTNTTTTGTTAAGVPQLVTVPDAAERLALSERTVRELCRTGVLPSVKIGGARRITTAALVAFIDARTVRS